MKKAIFLVEDIINNQPVTLYEKISWNLTNELEHCGRPLMWLRENPRLLSSYESEYIKFVKVQDIFSYSVTGWLLIISSTKNMAFFIVVYL